MDKRQITDTIVIHCTQTPKDMEVDVEKVISQVEETIPQHLRREVEALVIGELPEFKEKGFNAVYEGGTIYVTHIQDDQADMVDDIVHEFAHSVEEPHGFFIYGDSKIKDEFLNNINDLLNEFLNNSTKNTPKNSSEIFKEKTFFNPIFNNPHYYSRFLDKDYPSNPSINVNSDDFDEGFKEKWAWTQSLYR